MDLSPVLTRRNGPQPTRRLLSDLIRLGEQSRKPSRRRVVGQFENLRGVTSVAKNQPTDFV